MGPNLIALAVPFFFVFTRTALARTDPSLLEAGRMLGAGPLARFARITLPGLRGGLTAASILAFMTSMASFSKSCARIQRRSFLVAALSIWNFSVITLNTTFAFS